MGTNVKELLLDNAKEPGALALGLLWPSPEPRPKDLAQNRGIERSGTPKVPVKLREQRQGTNQWSWVPMSYVSFQGYTVLQSL